MLCAFETDDRCWRGCLQSRAPNTRWRGSFQGTREWWSTGARESIQSIGVGDEGRKEEAESGDLWFYERCDILPGLRMISDPIG